MGIVFRILLSISSVSLLPIIYFIKEQRNVFPYLISYVSDKELDFISNNIWIISYLLIPILLAYLVLLLIPLLSKESDISNEKVADIENQVNNFLPSYLGYIFIALSISNDFVLWIIFFIVIAFTFISQDNYFNPILLLFGYNFYKIKMLNSHSFVLISKQKFKVVKDVEVRHIYRINNYTFIQRK